MNDSPDQDRLDPPPPPMMDKPKLLSSTMLMASGTLVSRILGMVRVLLVGHLLVSQTIQADIFSIATTIPNQMYLLFAGGILTAILVPQLMRAITHDADGGQAFTDRIVTLFLMLIGGLTILLLVAHRYVVALVTQPAWRAPGMAAQYQSLITLTCLVLPQVFFFGAFFLGGQILNSRGSFGPFMWAPAVNNVIQVAMLGTYAVIWGFHNDTSLPFTTHQVLLLGLGSVLGIACQAAVLIPFLKKVGFRYRPRFDFLHTGLGATARLATWALAMVVITQINYVIVTRMAGVATLAGQGAGSYVLGSSMLIWFLPHSLLTVSLGTALLPSLSQLAARQQWGEFSEQFHSSLRIIFTAIIPLAFLLMALALPIGILAFGAYRGGIHIGWTLMVLSLGLIPVTSRFLIQRGYHSMSNTRTPFFIELVFVALTSAFAIFVVVVVDVHPMWVAPCIAAGYILGYTASAIQGWFLFRHAIPDYRGYSIMGHIARLVTISIPGALIAGWVMWGTIKPIIQLSILRRSGAIEEIPSRGTVFIGLVIALILGGGVYLVLAKLLKIPEIDELTSLISKKLRKEPTGGA
ncbi:MAG: hypothetical protein FWG08_06835 [Propionibacteriaceae bacterium]|nr:hypothetical protein [Propionibacteriaceae bacterium]